MSKDAPRIFRHQSKFVENPAKCSSGSSKNWPKTCWKPYGIYSVDSEHGMSRNYRAVQEVQTSHCRPLTENIDSDFKIPDYLPTNAKTISHDYSSLVGDQQFDRLLFLLSGQSLHGQEE